MNSYRGLGTKGRKVYKVKSRTELTESILNTLFTKRYETRKFVFPHAYPKLYPSLIKNVIPFELMNNLFYLSPMESPISTMETQTVGAQNVANILIKKLKA